MKAWVRKELEDAGAWAVCENPPRCKPCKVSNPWRRGKDPKGRPKRVPELMPWQIWQLGEIDQMLGGPGKPPLLKCMRCGGRWEAKSLELPKRCHWCHSTKWHAPDYRLNAKYLRHEAIDTAWGRIAVEAWDDPDEYEHPSAAKARGILRRLGLDERDYLSAGSWAKAHDLAHKWLDINYENGDLPRPPEETTT